MRPTISLGRWLGIPVGLHYSWLVIAWLITLSLADEFYAQNPEWTNAIIWTAATVTAAAFFVCIVLHELAHATIARLSGIPVRGITLFALGGIAQIEKGATTASKEFWIAIAGPIMSLVIGFGCRALAQAMGWTADAAAPSPIAAMLGWLSYINVGLALFNLIPGFPLDGGRVLRALVWSVTGDAYRSMRIAARVGQLVAYIFIAVGLFGVITRGDLSGLWITFIGWFMLAATEATVAQVEPA